MREGRWVETLWAHIERCCLHAGVDMNGHLMQSGCPISSFGRDGQARSSLLLAGGRDTVKLRRYTGQAGVAGLTLFASHTLLGYYIAERA